MHGFQLLIEIQILRGTHFYSGPLIEYFGD